VTASKTTRFILDRGDELGIDNTMMPRTSPVDLESRVTPAAGKQAGSIGRSCARSA
jgi:hypothetical protein